jgi:hypothetical protein
MSPGPNSSGGPGPGPMPPQPSTEPVNEFLVRRDRELTQQIDALRGQIAPKEQERETIRTAMRALGLLNELTAGIGINESMAGVGIGIGAAQRDRIIGVSPDNGANLGDLVGLVNSTLTIKQMILDALRDHFLAGATPSELRDYIRVAYGREVDRNSISPQLARLRDQGHVLQSNPLSTLAGKWILAPRGVSAADLVAIGHWPPGAEHQQSPEDPSDEEVGREIEARGLLGKITVERMRAFLKEKAKR